MFIYKQYMWSPVIRMSHHLYSLTILYICRCNPIVTIAVMQFSGRQWMVRYIVICKWKHLTEFHSFVMIVFRLSQLLTKIINVILMERCSCLPFYFTQVKSWKTPTAISTLYQQGQNCGKSPDETCCCARNLILALTDLIWQRTDLRFSAHNSTLLGRQTTEFPFRSARF